MGRKELILKHNTNCVRKICFIYFLFLLPAVYGQSLRQPVSAGYLGLGAYSRNHIDIFSINSNQASLAGLKVSGMGVYGERRFMLNETNLYSMALALVTTKGNFAVQADYFGFKNYNESQIGLAYGRQLGTKVDIGVKFNYYSFRIPGYGNASTVNFEAGIIAHLTEKVHAGVHVYNPVGGKFFKAQDEELGSAYTFGIGYEASEKFLVTTEIIKEEDIPVNVIAGMQYNFNKQFFVRGGVYSESTNTYAGVGIAWKTFRLDVSGSYHPKLGFSPGVLLIVNFK